MSEARWVDLDRRPPTSVSTGPHMAGAALPHADPQDPHTLRAGVKKRVTIAMPRSQRRLMDKLGIFVDKWLKRNLVPLPFDSDTSFETWIASTYYPEWRKAELRLKWQELGGWAGLTKKHFVTKGFMKDEPYTEWKHARSINSRTDEFKCAVGPIFRLIEKELFSLPYFIKKIPTADRPNYIKNLLSRTGAEYVATDYTAFEANFVKTLMEQVEMRLYKYMTVNLINGQEWYDLVHDVMTGTQRMQFKHFTAKVEATRMSGEMCTSLGNSFTNLMVMLFMCEEYGVKDVMGVVEGDDGLFVGTGSFPSEAEFKKLGLMLKMEKHKSLAEASFCGLVFDEHDLENIADPLKLMASFGWTTSQYAGAKKSKLLCLLRAKSMSYLCQYPACPVVASMARYGLRVTAGYDVRGVLSKTKNTWDRQFLHFLDDFKDQNRPIGMATRDLMERKFGLSVSDQLRLEAMFDSKDDLLPFDPRVPVPSSWVAYWDTYVARYARNDPLLAQPPHCRPGMRLV